MKSSNMINLIKLLGPEGEAFRGYQYRKLSDSEYVPDTACGYRLIRARDLFSGKAINWSEIAPIAHPGTTSFNRAFVRPGDLLIALNKLPLRTAIVSGTDYECVAGYDILVLRGRHIPYINTYLNSRTGREAVLELAIDFDNNINKDKGHRRVIKPSLKLLKQLEIPFCEEIESDLNLLNSKTLTDLPVTRYENARKNMGMVLERLVANDLTALNWSVESQVMKQHCRFDLILSSDKKDYIAVEVKSGFRELQQAKQSFEEYLTTNNLPFGLWVADRMLQLYSVHSKSWEKLEAYPSPDDIKKRLG